MTNMISYQGLVRTFPSEWQGLIREEQSEGSRNANLRADEQEHHTRRRLEASWHKTTKPGDLTATVNDAVVQGKLMFLSGELCLSRDRSLIQLGRWFNRPGVQASSP